MTTHLKNNKLPFLFLLLSAITPPLVAQLAGSETSRMEHAAADSMQRKIDFVKSNSKASRVDSRSTVFNQREINAYFAERRLKMPEGVQKVSFELSSGVVTANTTVDFDAITASARSHHPLLSIFSGVHDVQVVANASGRGHQVQVDVQSATIDGMSVPKIALQMFIEKWVNPRYPNIRMNGIYELPAKIDTVRIELRRGLITQK